MKEWTEEELRAFVRQVIEEVAKEKAKNKQEQVAAEARRFLANNV